MTDDVPIRDAATVIVVRDPLDAPRVLMGQRGKSAVFMPNKFVFPGGAVDASDDDVALADDLDPTCRARLGARSEGPGPEALAATAIRELWEETGHRLAVEGEWTPPNADWAGFGARPSGRGLHFFFRAVTPPGRPRRFDARFFLVSAESLLDDPDAMPHASDELSHLTWVRLDEVRRLDLAFITELVLAELARHLPNLGPPDRVPFIRNDRLDTGVAWL